jgi:hypothetical protein
MLPPLGMPCCVVDTVGHDTARQMRTCADRRVPNESGSVGGVAMEEEQSRIEAARPPTHGHTYAGSIQNGLE